MTSTPFWPPELCSAAVEEPLSPAELALVYAQYADELAALLEAKRQGRIGTAVLNAVTAGLGEIHVVLDELANQFTKVLPLCPPTGDSHVNH